MEAEIRARFKRQAEQRSLLECIACLPGSMRAEAAERFPKWWWDEHCWPVRRRPEQAMPAGRWRVWLVLAGRGWGKTRTGAETVRELALSGRAGRIALVGETAADVRGVMVEGPDGILNRCHPSERPRYEPSKGRVTFRNGAVALTYSGADPEQLRGPQHGFAWVDELAKFPYPTELWDNLMLGLRAGEDPRCIVTTTPRPVRVLRELAARAGQDVVVTRGSTYANATNLPGPFLEEIVRRYEGTTLGRQELYAQMLDEQPDALWSRAQIDGLRVPRAPELVRVAVGVDPSVSGDGSGAACGIVVAGIDGSNPAHAYVLADLTMQGGPQRWTKAVAKAYRKYEANLVVAEGNQGGDLVKQVLRAADERMPVEVVHAAKGKTARAEPMAMLYERGLVHHVGLHAELEDEMVNWVPGRTSPNRVDALVWALTKLCPAKAGEVWAEVM